MAQIPFFWALQNNKLVHINDVERGLACNCICPKCKSILVAHKGGRDVNFKGRKKENWHFQHYNSENCKGAAETSIHLAAKDLIERKNRIYVPILYEKSNQFGDIKILDYQSFKSISVNKEIYIGDIKADILMNFEFNIGYKTYFRQLIVEVAVTHFIDHIKKEKIKMLGISCIEISLDNLESITDEKFLWNEIKKRSNLEWIFNSKTENLLKKAENERHIDIYNQEKRFEYLQKKRDEELDEYRKSGYTFFKIYNYRRNFEGVEGLHKTYSHEGFLYCKEKSKNKDSKMCITKCKKCEFHIKVVHDGINYDSQAYTLCSFEQKKINQNINNFTLQY